MKKIIFAFVTFAISLTSCDTFLQGMGGGMGYYGGYGMGYQMFPGYTPPPTPPTTQQILNSAAQQVERQNQLGYQAAKRNRPNLTYDQYMAEQAAMYNMMKNSGGSSSTSTTSGSSYSSSSTTSSSSTSSRDCRRCMGTGKCQTCNGRGYYDEIGIGSGRHNCPNCASNHNGKCASCNGSGKM